MGHVPPIEETKQCIADALHFAAICAAQKVNVSTPEILSLQELHSALKKASPALHTSLQTLHSKYDQWLKFHESTPAEEPLPQAQAHNELEDARKAFLGSISAA